MDTPIAFHIGTWPVYWYGIFAAAGFIAAMAHWNITGAKLGYGPDVGSEIALWVMLGGILGARMAFVIANGDDFYADPIKILKLHEGGLIFYGGAIGGALATALYAWRRRFSLLSFGDFIITALPLGHALGRIGCFTRGCCYGAPCPDSSMGVLVMGVLRYPVQLYEAAANLLIYAVLLIMTFGVKRRGPGLVLAVYAGMYGTARFFLEYVRGDDRVMVGRWNVAQWISLSLVICGILLALRARGRAHASSKNR